ncbi:MAG TPA: MBG domain-containing protein, partial [Gammaproteobacteria bacterium]|nr:MBG domain-containing protein [Gammaproteobacteria bacterium]
LSYVNGAFAVTQKALTITANNQTKIYGSAFSFAGTEFTSNGLVNADSISSITLTSAATPVTATVAGSPYAIVGSAAVGSGLGNYMLSYVNGAFAVTQKALTITANNQTKVYGSAFTFAGTEFTSNGLVNADSISSITLTSAATPVTATVAGSSYPIVGSAAVGSGLGNYTIAYTNGSFAVTPKALTITANNQTKVYGSTFSFVGNEFTSNGLVNADSISSITLTSAATPVTATVAGSPYSIVGSAAVGSGLSNYTIAYTNGSFAVTPKALTITANNQSKVYGNSFTFAGTEFTSSGLVNSDSVSSATLTSAATLPAATIIGSPYSITPSAALGSGLSNYTINYVNGSFTVTPFGLTITATNQSKTYGTVFNFMGTEFTAVGLVGPDTVTGVTLTSLGSPATANVAGSPYLIIPSAAMGTGLVNYTITYSNGLLTVNPAALIITANNQSKTSGQTSTFTGTEFTASGLQNGESIGRVTLNSLGAPSTASVAGSPYLIITSAATGGTFNPGNYAITYSNKGLLTIAPLVSTGDTGRIPNVMTMPLMSSSKLFYGDINHIIVVGGVIKISGTVVEVNENGSTHVLSLGDNIYLGDNVVSENGGNADIRYFTDEIFHVTPVVVGEVIKISGTVVDINEDGSAHVLSLGDYIYLSDKFVSENGGNADIRYFSDEIFHIAPERMSNSELFYGDINHMTVVGEVIGISGTVIEVNMDGSTRVLTVGDSIYLGDNIISENSGSSVDIRMFTNEIVHVVPENSQEFSKSRALSRLSLKHRSSSHAIVVGKVINIAGTVTEINIGGSRHVLKAGDNIYLGDRVTVARGGRVDIRTSTNKIVHIAPEKAHTF